jgi:hypothetical protein
MVNCSLCKAAELARPDFLRTAIVDDLVVRLETAVVKVLAV